MKLWIARDEFEILSFHKTKPLYDKILHRWSNLICYFQKDEFKKVTFENSPQEVELKLKNKLSFKEMEELIDDLI